MESKFRKPDEMTEHEDRVPLSTRVKASTKETLMKHRGKRKLSEIAATVLDDYAQWLRDEMKKKR